MERIIRLQYTIVLACFLSSIFIFRFLSTIQGAIPAHNIINTHLEESVLKLEKDMEMLKTALAKVQKLPNPVGEIVAASTSSPQAPTHDAAFVHTLPPSIRGTNPVGEIIDSSISPVYEDKIFLVGCNKPDQISKMTVELSPPSEDFKCDRIKKKKTVNFLSCAVGEKYENVLPMYALYALTSNNNSVVEMVVVNSTDFTNRKKGPLSWISKFANKKSGAICVRDYDKDHSKRTGISNTWRFLEVPYVKANYTYLADVDIYLRESVLQSKRLEQMSFFNLPYSNCIRPNTTRLTGVMLVETEKFYTTSLIKAQQEVDFSKGENDEVVLYKLANATHGLPTDAAFANTSEEKAMAAYRPVHGIHLSYNRGPGKGLCQINYKTITNELFALPELNDFLCHDQSAYDMLSHVVNDSYIQDKFKMTNKISENGRVCK